MVSSEPSQTYRGTEKKERGLATVKGRVGLHRNRFHQYAWGASPWQPGVTTILRVQDAIGGSDGLVRWATRLAAEAAFDHARRPESPLFEDALASAIAAVDGARDRGTRIHDGWDAAVRGEPYTPAPEDGKVFYHLMRWVVQSKPQIMATEQMVINLSAGYGGTFDLDAIIDGKRSLVDLKTGKPKPEHALQLAAYAAGEWIGLEDDPEKYDLPQFEAFYVLALNDEGYELIPFEVGEKEIEHFLYLAETYKRLKLWSKEQA